MKDHLSSDQVKAKLEQLKRKVSGNCVTRVEELSGRGIKLGKGKGNCFSALSLPGEVIFPKIVLVL